MLGVTRHLNFVRTAERRRSLRLQRGVDLTFIEVMPLGEIDVARADQYLPLDRVRAGLMDRFASVFDQGGRLFVMKRLRGSPL
jgi:molybdenum cofactor biosynthesis enzyme MoaA